MDRIRRRRFLDGAGGLFAPRRVSVIE